MRLIAASFAGLLTFCVGAEASQCYRRVLDPPQYPRAVTRQGQEWGPPERTAGVLPAGYAGVGETVEAIPAHNEWRTRSEGGEAIGCWVRVPARYAARIRRVATRPDREVAIPGRHVTRERRALASPARGRWVRIEDCER